tara:strand:- start:795 stop:1010 length:216 start_codon:yes stop_codon:yes gene_type:complete
MKRFQVNGLLLVGFLFLTNIANACSACFSANEKTRIAYYATTAFLSFLPLIMLGILVWWLRHFFRSPNLDE